MKKEHATQMLRLKLSVTAVMIYATVAFIGCGEKIVDSQRCPESFEVAMDQYSQNHFFVDTGYIDLYEPYYRNIPPTVDETARIVEIEVWVQKPGVFHDSTDRFGCAWMNLPMRPASGYGSSYRQDTLATSHVFRGWFSRLPPGSYSLDADGYVGVLSIDSVPASQLVIAVSYRRADGIQFGDFLYNGFVRSTDSSMVLKMVRPQNLAPSDVEAWKMQLRNIYKISTAHVSEHNSWLEVFFIRPDGRTYSWMGNHSLMEILGVDRYGSGGYDLPDGMFDFRPGFTIDQERGEIIFPSLEPFNEGIVRFFHECGSPLPDSITVPALYNATVEMARNSVNYRYVIRGYRISD